MCLGNVISKIDNETNKECWAIPSDKYFTAAVANVTENLEKSVLMLHSKFLTLLSNGYIPELDTSV